MGIERILASSQVTNLLFGRDSIFHLPLAASNPSLLLRIQCWGASQSWILCCPRRKFSEMSFPVAARRSVVANPHSGGPKEVLRYFARYAHRAANDARVHPPLPDAGVGTYGLLASPTRANDIARIRELLAIPLVPSTPSRRLP
jgi:hypothetical protein